MDTLESFGEYLHTNEQFVREIAQKIANHDFGGMFDFSSDEQIVGEFSDEERGQQLEIYFSGAPERCDICGGPFVDEKYMVDGKIRETDAWGCMCANCFRFHGDKIEWGSGQLYLADQGSGKLVKLRRVHVLCERTLPGHQSQAYR